MQYLEAESLGEVFKLTALDWAAALEPILGTIRVSLQAGRPRAARDGITKLLEEGWLRIRAVRIEKLLGQSFTYLPYFSCLLDVCSSLELWILLLV